MYFHYIHASVRLFPDVEMLLRWCLPVCLGEFLVLFLASDSPNCIVRQIITTDKFLILLNCLTLITSLQLFRRDRCEDPIPRYWNVTKSHIFPVVVKRLLDCEK